MQVSLSSKLAKFKRIALELYYRFSNAGFAEGEILQSSGAMRLNFIILHFSL